MRSKILCCVLLPVGDLVLPLLVARWTRRCRAAVTVVSTLYYFYLLVVVFLCSLYSGTNGYPHRTLCTPRPPLHQVLLPNGGHPRAAVAFALHLCRVRPAPPSGELCNSATARVGTRRAAHCALWTSPRAKDGRACGAACTRRHRHLEAGALDGEERRAQGGATAAGRPSRATRAAAILV